jgi:hypothetical protein
MDAPPTTVSAVAELRAAMAPGSSGFPGVKSHV